MDNNDILSLAMSFFEIADKLEEKLGSGEVFVLKRTLLDRVFLHIISVPQFRLGTLGYFIHAQYPAASARG